VTGLRLGRSHLTIDIQDGGWDLPGSDGTGIELVRGPRPCNAPAQPWPRQP